MLNLTTIPWILLLCSVLLTQSVFAQTIDLEVTDEESGLGVPARLRFTKGATRVSRPKGILNVGTWWLAQPEFSISPKGGEFEFLVQRGHEFTDVRGGFTMERAARDIISVAIPRSTDMRSENWYSGDHYCILPEDQSAKWQVADGIDFVVSAPEVLLNPGDIVAPLPTKQSAGSKTTRPKKSDREALEVSTDPSTLGLRQLTSARVLNPVHGPFVIHRKPISSSAGDSPNAAPPGSPKADSASNPPLDKVEAWMPELDRSQLEGHVAEMLAPWTRDVPLLLSTGSIRSVQLLSSVNRPESDEPIVYVSGSEKSGIFGRVQTLRGKERVGIPIFATLEKDDKLRFRGGDGVGRLVEHLYWMMLESGMRLAPTAGSGFGLGDTYLGYNRTYVYCDSQPDWSSYWQSVSLGKTTVTNGPLLRASINQFPPGANQVSQMGVPIALDIAVSLSVREPVDYIDVVFNGETIYSAKLEDHYNRGEFPPLEIQQSGWLVIRVVTAHEKGHRLASTAPFYFELDGKPRISRKAVEYMLAWLNNATSQLKESDEQWRTYEPSMTRARVFWDGQLQRANAP